jgi:ATP-dependent RNA helicase RhlE
MRFEELDLIHPLLKAVKEQGYSEPTDIQVQAIPYVLEGRDLIGLAQTGTGKTAAFALPMLQHLTERGATHNRKSWRPVRALILAPTRELAAQIGDSFREYGRHTPVRQTTIFGGVGQRPQEEALKRGTDVVVATPGRLLDLMNQGLVHFRQLEVLVLDEADRMLDMGFLPDIQRIIGKLPTVRQTLLFSATMPPAIQDLAQGILRDPVEVAVTPESTTVEAIAQWVYFVEKDDKRRLLQHLLRETGMARTLVFTRTKHAANRLSETLEKANIPSAAIHGNKSQKAREKALEDFKQGRVRVLVATDIAARGIDVDHISHVVNFDLPNESESYVHRIGRTGRAGATGMALSFCALDERGFLRDIERLIQMHIPAATDYPYASAQGQPRPTELQRERRGPQGSGPASGKGGSRPPARRRRSGSGRSAQGRQNTSAA